jgi:hypothetical protein
MQTQTEVNSTATAGNRYRRADSDMPGNKYRLYEVAGMPHNDSRENPNYRPDPCEKPSTKFPVGAMMAVGLHHLIQWVDKGIAPPHGDVITVDNDTTSDGSPLALDEHGNAKGGVRNTYVDLPVARYGVPNTAKPGFAPETRADFYCGIAGYESPLAPEKLKALYGDHKNYERRVDQRLKQLIKEGWFLPVYTKQVTEDAAQVALP